MRSILSLRVLISVCVILMFPFGLGSHAHADSSAPPLAKQLARAQPNRVDVVTYEIIPLDAAINTPLLNFDLNNRDQITGSRVFSPSINSTTFLWQYDDYTNIGTFPGVTDGFSNPYALNDDGHIVGIAQISEFTSHAFLWRNGVMTDLDVTTNGSFVQPLGINNSDVVVGEASFTHNYYYRQAWIWQDHAGTPLPPYYDCAYQCYSRAVAVNDNNIAVGYDVAPCGGITNSYKAVRWVNGATPIIVGDTTACLASFAADINASGNIVGKGQTADDYTMRAFLWKSDGTAIDLQKDVPDVVTSEAIAINDNNQVLVKFNFSDYSQYGIWDNGNLFAVNDLLPSNTDWIVHDVFSINNAGHIIGSGNKGAFLLAPHDTDKDALPDIWETGGVKRDGVLIDLPRMGADPLHKDIFIHVDHMESYPASLAALQIVIDAFEAAPLDNPDGTNGIRLHIDAGPNTTMNPITNETWNDLSRAVALTDEDTTIECNSYTFDGKCKGYDWDDFDARVKDAYLAAKRDHIFYYACICSVLDKITDPTTSGLARGAPSADFVVTLGGWTTPGGTLNQKAGTFMHELGHVLGLQHGGDADINHKPNYLSVMNYTFQVTGLRRNNSLTRTFDFSRRALPALNEHLLDENIGIADPDQHLSTFHRGNNPQCFADPDFDTRLPYPALDWNCNGQADNFVFADLNGDSKLETLTGFEDWAHIQFGGGGAIGKLGAAIPTDAVATPEATFEDMLKILPQDELLEFVVEPVALFVASPISGTAPLHVNLDASAAFSPNGALTNYAWNFGDGAQGNGKITAHTFTNAGTYTIHLTVTDSAQQSNSISLPVTITVTNGCAFDASAPAQLKPTNNAALKKRNVKFDWSDVTCATHYRLQILKKKNGAPLHDIQVNVSNAAIKLPKPTKLTKYFWRVQACADQTCSPFTPLRKFTLQP